jgi:hypothetical protein
MLNLIYAWRISTVETFRRGAHNLGRLCGRLGPDGNSDAGRKTPSQRRSKPQPVSDRAGLAIQPAKVGFAAGTSSDDDEPGLSTRTDQALG